MPPPYRLTYCQIVRPIQAHSQRYLAPPILLIRVQLACTFLITDKE